jgi:hypothetical protein
MPSIPDFPTFKPIELADRDFVQGVLDGYQPLTSEWTFTNLFIWRSHYHFRWSMYGDWLVVICGRESGEIYALAPIGPVGRESVTRELLEWLGSETDSGRARIERADQRIISELQTSGEFLVEPARDQFDYVYRSENLVKLAGRKYHSKRNHINKFRRTHAFEYRPYDSSYQSACEDLADAWCTLRRCEDDLNLTGEWDALREALEHFDALKLTGGVILMEGEVKAFALGELLNDRTAIVHIEKADPEIQGLYAVINQQFCENAWGEAEFVNREQDLGEPGLRKAKLSYYPHHLEEKFTISLNG